MSTVSAGNFRRMSDSGAAAHGSGMVKRCIGCGTVSSGRPSASRSASAVKATGGASFVMSSSVSPAQNLLRCVSTVRPSGAVPSTTAQTSAPAK